MYAEKKLPTTTKMQKKGDDRTLRSQLLGRNWEERPSSVVGQFFKKGPEGANFPPASHGDGSGHQKNSLEERGEIKT